MEHRTHAGSGDEAPSGDPSATAAALAAIERLHERDRGATRTLDVPALLALWTPDGAGVGPGGRIVRRDAMAEQMRRSAEAADGQVVVAYEQSFEEIEVVGDWAWELGSFVSITRDPQTGQETRMEGPMLRILKRGADGEWRFHRSMWSLSGDA